MRDDARMNTSTTRAAVTLEDIQAARERIAGRARVTPMVANTALTDRLGFAVGLKCENLQRTGSFKVRGAMNIMATMGAVPGVVAASAGNHAQGVALAAAEYSIPATVVMPVEAPLAKQVATRDYGAEVILVDGSLAMALERAREIADERDLVFIPPFDHPAIVAGQGTLGVEVVEQMPDLDTVVVPAGGGGLLAGVAVAVKTLRPKARVIGVQTAAMPGIVDSLRSGSLQTTPHVRTTADGAAVAGPSALTLDLIDRYVDEVVTVSEESIAQALVFLIERARLVVEGAGALSTAALLTGAVQDSGNTVVVVSGGNIDINVLGRIVARGLVHEGRHRELTVAAANVPGELAQISSALARAGANILEVSHDLVAGDLPVGVGRLTFRVEISSADVFDDLVETMLAHGLLRGTLTDLSTPAATATPH